MKLRNILAGAGVVAALAFASAASATTYDLGPLSISTPLAVSVTASGAVNDEFDFSIAPPPLTTYGQLIDFFVQNNSGKLLSNVFTDGTVTLYDSTNAVLDTVDISTAPDAGSTTLTDTINLGVGSYHFVVKGDMAAPSGNYTFGIFGAAVPEPASWAMMILGVGLIGASLRRRQSVATLA
jgi:hypothetical protein